MRLLPVVLLTELDTLTANRQSGRWHYSTSIGNAPLETLSDIAGKLLFLRVLKHSRRLERLDEMINQLAKGLSWRR